MADSDRCSRYFEKFDYPMLKFDYPMLWLNYEDKMDELRNRFLTIASILFAVQVGIFALIVDKIVLTEAKNGTLESRHFIAGIVLIIFSVIILLFLHWTYRHYSLHIYRNFYRSKFIECQYCDVKKLKNQQKDYIKRLEAKTEDSKHQKNYLKTIQAEQAERDPLDVPRLIYRLYLVVFGSTVVMVALGWVLNVKDFSRHLVGIGWLWQAFIQALAEFPPVWIFKSLSGT